MKTLNHYGVAAIRELCKTRNGHEKAARILAFYGATKFSEVPPWHLSMCVTDLEREAFGSALRPYQRACIAAIDEAFKTKEEPTMKLTMLEALCLYTTKSDVSDKPARKALLKQAQEMVNGEKTRLYQAADAKAEAERTLVNLELEDSAELVRKWVRRTFSDGTSTRHTEPTHYANQLRDTFEAGKKAGAKAAQDVLDF